MSKPRKTKLSEYVHLDTLDTSVDKFVDEGYVNYIKRTGGQVNQFYSLSNSVEDESGSYRETEVIFSREVFKRVVLTTKLFPIGILPDDITTSFFPRNKERDDFYLRGRINPSSVERSHATMLFTEGIFKNVRRQNMTVDKSKASMSLIGGEFRLPRFDFYPDPITLQPDMVFMGGLFKKALIHTYVRESIKNKPFRLVEMVASTRNRNDVLELNFKSKPFPQESNKVSFRYLNTNTTTIDSLTYLTEGASLRTLTKNAGIAVSFKDSSTLSFYGKVSLGIDFYLRELTPGGYLMSLEGASNSVKLNDLDPTQLEVSSTTGKHVTPSGTIEKNRWYKLVFELDDTNTKVFLDGELLHTFEGATLLSILVRDPHYHNRRLYIGNNVSGRQGLLANFDKLYITKNVLSVTEDTLIDKTSEIVATDLSFDTELTEAVEGITWTTDGPIELENRQDRTAYSLIANSLYSSVSPDLMILPANNFRIEVEVEPLRLPTVDIPERVILSDESTYRLGLVYYNNDTRVRFKYGDNYLLSYSSIKIGKPLSIKIYKIREYLVMSIDDKFDSLMKYGSFPYTEKLSGVTVGKSYDNSEFNFYGYLYSLKMTNFYRDIGLFDKYYPENISDIVVLNFEEGYLDEGGPYREWTETSPDMISNQDFKFGEKSLKDGHIFIERDAGLSLGTGEFTFEAWVKPTERTPESVLLANGRPTLVDYAGLYPKIVITGEGKLAVKMGARKAEGYFITSKDEVPLNQWSHIAVVREGRDMYLYINGKRTAVSTVEPPSLDFSYEGTHIGNTNLPDNENTQFKGYIDSLRLVKGIPIYTGETYNIPTLPASTNINTSLLRVTNELPGDDYVSGQRYFHGVNPYHSSKEQRLESLYDSKGSVVGRYIEDVSNAIYRVSYEVTPSNYLRLNRSIDRPWFNTKDLTLKKSVFIDRDTPDTKIFCLEDGADVWHLSLKDKKLAIYVNDRKVSSESTLDMEFEKWYVVTLIRKSNRYLVFLDGVEVINQDLQIPESQGSYYTNLVQFFKGNVENTYVSYMAEHLGSHIVRYPLYFKKSFSKDSNYTWYGTINNEPQWLDSHEKFTVSATFIRNTDNRYLLGLTSGSNSLYVSVAGNGIDITARRQGEAELTTRYQLEKGKDDIIQVSFTKDKTYKVYIEGNMVYEGTLPEGQYSFSVQPSGLSTYGYLIGEARDDLRNKYGGHIQLYTDRLRTEAESIANDDYNVLPRGRILDSTGVKLTPTSIWRRATYFSGEAYQTIEKFSKLPPNRYSIEMWVKAVSLEGHLLTLVALEDEERVLLDITPVEGMRLNEWQHLRLTYAEDTWYTYLNGNLVKQAEGEPTEQVESVLTLGKGFTGILDYVKISRVPDSLDVQEKFNPLHEVFEESKIVAEDLEFPNLNFNYGLTYWTAEPDIHVVNKTLACDSNAQRKVSYTLDVSNMLHHGKKLWVSFDQYNTNNLSKAGLTVKFYCTGDYGNQALIHIEELPLATNLEEAKRYLTQDLVSGVTHVVLEFSLNRGSSISGIEVLIDEITGVFQQEPKEELYLEPIKLEKEIDDYGYSFTR